MHSKFIFLIVILFFSSCGIVTKTRYGNGLKWKFEFFKKADKEKSFKENHANKAEKKYCNFKKEDTITNLISFNKIENVVYENLTSKKQKYVIDTINSSDSVKLAEHRKKINHEVKKLNMSSLFLSLYLCLRLVITYLLIIFFSNITINSGLGLILAIMITGNSIILTIIFTILIVLIILIILFNCFSLIAKNKKDIKNINKIFSIANLIFATLISIITFLYLNTLM